jgi:hypothetical protein
MAKKMSANMDSRARVEIEQGKHASKAAITWMDGLK